MLEYLGFMTKDTCIISAYQYHYQQVRYIPIPILFPEATLPTYIVLGTYLGSNTHGAPIRLHVQYHIYHQGAQKPQLSTYYAVCMVFL